MVLLACPECLTEVYLVPERKPLPPSTTTNTITANTFTMTGNDYSPTSREYKCCNDKCWVTKIKLSWS